MSNFYKGFCEICENDLDACSKCYKEKNVPTNFKYMSTNKLLKQKEKSIHSCPHCGIEDAWVLVRSGDDMNGEEKDHHMVEMYQCVDCLGYFNVYLNISKVVALKEF